VANQDGPKANDRYLVPAADLAARVLFCLSRSQSPRMSLIEICQQLEIHKSRAFSILHTLQKYGLIQRNVEQKGYSLGPGIVSLARRFLEDLRLPKLAEPILKKLAITSEGTAALGMIADGYAYVVARHEGERETGLVTIRVGHRLRLTTGSHGKAIAAFLDEDELESILAQKKLYFHGSPEKFDRKRLGEVLSDCRLDGFALELGEVTPGLNTVAAPVFGVHGRPIGYIVLLGLFSGETAYRLGPSVAKGGRDLSRLLGGKVD
jgi:DNA-binding IclR family transcriptional regulator